MSIILLVLFLMSTVVPESLMKTLSSIFYFIVTAFAVVYTVVTFVLNHAILWWMENGDKTLTRIVRFILLTLDVIGEVYYAGKDFRIFINHIFNKVLDFLYFQSLAIYN
jgi:hypothetical protein